MIIKNYNLLIFVGIISLLLSSCSTVKKAFDPERKNSSEEFFVEKKSPLSMPPEFDELPVPQSSIEENEDQSEDIKILITDKNSNQSQIDEIEGLDISSEELILDKIKNN
jgi:hypothetical protein